MIPTEQAPFGTDTALAEYLSRLVRGVSQEFRNKSLLAPNTAVPDTPEDGRIYFFPDAVGVITSAGFWGYNGGWSKLG